jgi:hypothetical protein
MATSEAQKRANAKYDKANMHKFLLSVHKENEKDIIKWLNQQENKNGYIKNLIRADMQKHRT